MAYPYSSALIYIGVGVQGAVGTPASAPDFYLPIDRAGTKQVEWMEGRTEVDYATGDYYTEVDAPIMSPHAEGTLVVPAKMSQLSTFLADCGIIGGASPGTELVPPVPITIFQGIGGEEEVYQDVFVTGQPTFTVTDTASAQWNFPVIGMAPPVTHAVRTPTFPVYEEPWRLSDLRGVTMIVDSTVVRLSSFTATLILDTQPQYYSRGDGLPYPSDIVLQKLGGFVDFRRAFHTTDERAAFLAVCGQTGPLVFPFSRTCGSTTRTLQFTLTSGLHVKRTVDAPNRALIGESFTTRGLRGPTTPYSPVKIAYT
jgi:hypothetical protein